MTDPDGLWDLETSFWLEGRDFYERRLAADAVMLLPYPMGLQDRDAVLKSLESMPRWSSVEFAGQSLRRRDGTAVLAYRATGWRGEGDPAYVALCASTYVLDDGDWRMMSHSQQPLDATEI